MDGLTVRSAESLLQSGQTASQQKASKQKLEVAGPAKSFSETLDQAVRSVNELQKVADKKMEALATGKAKNIPDVMIAAERADIALKLMVQVRNKMIDAYQEVMKMQV